MKYIFVVNPVAGKGKLASSLVEKINEVASSKGVDYEVYLTKSLGDGCEYVKKAADMYSGELAFFACGGDGTVCEVANGIMACADRERLYLGIVPAGTGNDFVRNFTEPKQFLDIGAQLEHTDMEMDLVSCNGDYCVNMINIGFDCQVVCHKEALQRNKLFPPKLAYVGGLLITLIKKPGLDCRISFDGKEAEPKKLLLTTVGNGEYCGGGFHSNPESAINSGKLNVITVDNVTRLKFLSLVGSYKNGTHLKYTDVIGSHNATAVVYEFDTETNYSIDGDVKSAKTLELKCESRAIKLIVPKNCEYLKKEIKDGATEPCRA